MNDMDEETLIRACDECGDSEFAWEAPDWVNGMCTQCDPTINDTQEKQ